MTDLPAEKPVRQRESIAKGKELVEKWATRFGFGHYSRRVKLMPKSKRQHFFALVYFDHEEEFFDVELVPDGSLPAKQLEYVVIHEMTHGLVGYAHQHVQAEEVICNRVARAFTKSRGPNEHHYKGGDVIPKGGPAPRTSVLVDALPDREREVISRLFFGQASMGDVATELNLSKRQVGRIRDRALLRMGGALVRQQQAVSE